MDDNGSSSAAIFAGPVANLEMCFKMQNAGRSETTSSFLYKCFARGCSVAAELEIKSAFIEKDVYTTEERKKGQINQYPIVQYLIQRAVVLNSESGPLDSFYRLICKSQ